MSIPSTIAEYLSCFSQELGDRILQIYPALQAPQDPVSERFKTLLRSPFAAQRLAVMGIVKRWHRAKAAAVIAECGTGKTLMALSAIHVRSAGRPYAALVVVVVVVVLCRTAATAAKDCSRNFADDSRRQDVCNR